MKPHLLLVLLLAIPPLICNILACENAEAPETAPAAKSVTVTKEISAPVVAPVSHVGTPATKPSAPPAKSGSAPSRFPTWSMM